MKFAVFSGLISPRYLGENMKKIAVTVLALAAGFLASCQSQWDAARSAQEARYVGKSVDNVYEEWGVPFGVVTKTDGGKFMQFQRYIGEFRCTADVTVNASAIVTRIAVGGQNGCVM